MFHAPVLIRPFAIGFAAVLGLFAAWIIIAELMRPSVAFFPTDTAEATAASLENSSAAAAAWFGWPRSDLWADYAVTTNAELIGASMSTGPASHANNPANETAETAATLAPSDARPWLLLAMNEQGNDSKTLALLKMSYYTSPYDDALFPLRILIATRSPSIADEELSSFVEYELGVAVGHKPNLRPSITAAYRTASPQGRAFFDKAIAKLDPNYLSQLKAAKP